MGTALVTGSASGIGAAVRKRLESQGDRVIGVDLRDAEICCDLSTSKGREEAVREALERCDGTLDRLVTCAGLGPATKRASLISSVNYFGAVDVFDGLLPALTQGAAAASVAIVSNSAQMAPLDDTPFVQALLDGDEAKASRIIDDMDSPIVAYMGSKHALGRAIRRRVRLWGTARVRLNGVAPGPVDTPLLKASLEDPIAGPPIANADLPLGRLGRPDDIAALVSFLLGAEASWIHGSIFFVDGGNDADIRPDRY